MASRVGFIGLGNMGLPMALNLARAGYHVVGFDLDEAARERGAAAGLSLAEDAAAAIEGAEVVISMLPAGEHVTGLFLGEIGSEDGLFHRLSPGTLVLDCSTIAPEAARRVGVVAEDRGLDFLDAPVSGGTSGAAGGTLTFIVGGAAESVERARPLFQEMGTSVFHAGAVGGGQTAKLCNNMLLAILMVGTSEALALGVESGLDPTVLSSIMASSSGGNWVLERYNPFPGVMESVPAAKGYRGGFGSRLMLKDLDLAMGLSREMGASVHLGAAARNLYAMFAKSDGGDLDFSGILKLVRGRSD